MNERIMKLLQEKTNLLRRIAEIDEEIERLENPEKEDDNEE